MLDQLARKICHKPLNIMALGLQKLHVSPNILTLLGLGIGLMVLPILSARRYDLAVVLILINRLIDGLDGPLARRLGPSDYGAYLDIVCDMIFYAAIVLGMALAQPENALWSAVLLFSFMGTSASFLAFAILAEKHQLKDPEKRGLYYLEGLAEGTESILFFIAFMLFPWLYKGLALAFSLLCWLTIMVRLVTVRRRLRP